MAPWLNILLTKINKVCIGIDMKRVDFHLTEEQIEFLKRLKKETGIPASETIRQLINSKIEELDYGRKEGCGVQKRSDPREG